MTFPRSSTKRHPSIIRIKSHLDAEGRIIAREVDVNLDAGAYAGLSSVVLKRNGFCSALKVLLANDKERYLCINRKNLDPVTGKCGIGT